MATTALITGREMARRTGVRISTLVYGVLHGRVRPDFVSYPGNGLLFRPSSEERIRRAYEKKP